jgi:hypothetical protein
MARPRTRSTQARSKRSRNEKSQYFESESSEDDQPRSKSSKAKRVKSNKLATQESLDEEPWETFIPKEPSPDAGDMEYQNSTIHPNTLHFLEGYLPVGKVNWRFSGEQ